MAEYSNPERKILLKLAADSIEFGLNNGNPLAVEITDFTEHLRHNRASFVTLHIAGQLRGCIGSLQAYQPLVQDIAGNAFAAAFSDPRFPPLSKEEFPQLEIQLSILSQPEPISFSSETELIKQLRPNVDGLILSDVGHRGTFLPSVWEQLPEPAQFFTHLKLKAGLPQNYWSDTLRVERYTTEPFS